MKKQKKGCEKMRTNEKIKTVKKGIGIVAALAMLGILTLSSVAIAVSESGDAWAWGANNCGQLGDNTTTGRGVPAQVINLTDVIQIAGGNCHTIALKSDGTVWAVGWNVYGQLGDNTTTNRWVPVQVIGLTDIIKIKTMIGHNVALKSDGTVWTWGSNVHGQIGDGTTVDRLTPFQVANLTGVIDIASGWGHTYALLPNNTIVAWGANYMGQLGDGTTISRSIPIQVNLTNVVKIASGWDHGMAIKSDGTVWTWGYNDYGQLGDNTTQNRWTPVQVDNLTNAVEIAGGSQHSVAVIESSESDGEVAAWGRNSVGQLGDGTSITRLTPVRVANLTEAIDVSGGRDHTVVLRSNGTIMGWGGNYAGQLGVPGVGQHSLVPVQIVGITNVIQVAAGDFHTVAIISVMPIPTNVTFLLPLEDGKQYNATVGSKIPIRFTARNISTGAFVYDSTASINITDIDGINLVKFNLTDGLSVNYSAERYEVEFNASNYSAFVNGEVYSVRAALENPGGPTGSAMSSFKIGTLPAVRHINGTVIDSVSKIGISGVNVSTNAGNSTVTNATGFYSLAVGSGIYELTVKLNPTHYENNSVTVSTVGKAVRVQYIELEEKPKGSIAGVVRII